MMSAPYEGSGKASMGLLVPLFPLTHTEDGA